MTRIGKRFEELNEQKALVAFLTAGDPDIDTTKKIFTAIEKNGADIIEIGVPFTDPLADGPVILQSALRSLNNGTTLRKILNMVSDIRESSELPIVLMSSFNPVFVYGEKAFVDDAVRAGVDGVIIPDLPPEEAGELADCAGKKDLDIIYLLAPTSTENRVKVVTRQSRGFIYYISLTGVTGTRAFLPDGLHEKVNQIKKTAALPVLVGFGISDSEQAKKAAEISDGVIIGSAIMKIIDQIKNPSQIEAKVGNFIASVKKAIS